MSTEKGMLLLNRKNVFILAQGNDAGNIFQNFHLSQQNLLTRELNSGLNGYQLRIILFNPIILKGVIMFCPFDRGFKCADCPLDYGKGSITHRTHVCSKLNFSLNLSPAKPAVYMKKGPDGGCEDIS
jgi:hypothetical protein